MSGRSDSRTPALTGQRLVDKLNSVAASARHRLWIASPYVGSWNDVKKILGVAWEKVDDVRLLVDKDSGYLSRDTLERFAAHRPLHSLQGLHAKLYVVDDFVLLTSANLTGYAFKKRHEVGLLLSGQAAQHLVSLYEHLWTLSAEIAVEDVPTPRGRQGTSEEPHGTDLPDLWTLPQPPDPRDTVSRAFLDYPHFLAEYKQFVKAYLSCGGPDAPELPIYFETDAFLNFLFQGRDQPSQPFKTNPPRNLSDADRRREIATARARFRKDGWDAAFHVKRSRAIRRLLKRTNLKRLSRVQMIEVASKLNCFGRNALARSRFISNNRIGDVRRAWASLIYGEGAQVLRMQNCKASLYGFGRSAIQELIGYHSPKEYPLRNQNVNAGLRFLGYNVKAK
jgi:hypothetical protein